jgi:hypothetical protein
LARKRARGRRTRTASSGPPAWVTRPRLLASVPADLLSRNNHPSITAFFRNDVTGGGVIFLARPPPPRQPESEPGDGIRFGQRRRCVAPPLYRVQTRAAAGGWTIRRPTSPKRKRGNFCPRLRFGLVCNPPPHQPEAQARELLPSLALRAGTALSRSLYSWVHRRTSSTSAQHVRHASCSAGGSFPSAASSRTPARSASRRHCSSS